MHDVVRFGRFEVRPGERTLLADGRPVPLGGRAFDLLLALIEQRQRVVTKDELLDHVWPGLVVEENNLQVQVSSLRKLLGADAIKTVPGRGYRFAPADVQVAADSSAPALPTVVSAPPRPGLPQRATPLLGRDDEVAALLARLDAHPLVTLVGPGGIGKTTLARAALTARQAAWRDGVAWVDLAALNDAALIPGAVAQALALPLAAQAEPLAALVEAARPLQLLLVLDNAEHLIDGVAAVALALLQGTPGLRLLVTSQAPLHLEGEQVLRLDALAVPAHTTAAAAALRSGAVALFVQRAAAADRRFALDDGNVATVVEICRRLDGLPLALELAAARVPLLGVRGVAERLDERFKLLAGASRSAPTRQQTLQAALAWSLALLPALERSVFERLAVFSGGFTLELARDALVGDGLDEWTLIEALATLVDRSLLGVSLAEGSDAARYTLTETARAYALEHLAHDAAEHAAGRARHAQALRRWFDAAPADWLRQTDADWLARYEPELGNLRAALQWAEAHDGETLVALVGTAAPLWHHLSLHAEARRWHASSERHVTDAAIPPPLAAAWWRAAQWAFAETDPGRARIAAAYAEHAYRALGDAHGLYAQLTGAAALHEGDSADTVLREALALEQPHWPPRERAWGQRARADVARAQGRLAASRAARDAELALRIEAGDERGRLRALSHLVDLALAMDSPREAVRVSRELVERLRGQRLPALLCRELAKQMRAHIAGGDAGAARALWPEAAALATATGQQGVLSEVGAELCLAITDRGS